MAHFYDAQEDTSIGCWFYSQEKDLPKRMVDGILPGGDQKVEGDQGYVEEMATSIDIILGKFSGLHSIHCKKLVIAVSSGCARRRAPVFHVVCDLTLAAVRDCDFSNRPDCDGDQFHGGCVRLILAKCFRTEKGSWKYSFWKEKTYSAKEAYEIGNGECRKSLMRLNSSQCLWVGHRGFWLRISKNFQIQRCLKFAMNLTWWRNGRSQVFSGERPQDGLTENWRAKEA